MKLDKLLGTGIEKNPYTGRLRPEGQLLILLYAIIDRKGVSFVYRLPLTNGTAFTNLAYNFVYLLTAVLMHCLYPFILRTPEKGTTFWRSLPVQAIVGSIPRPWAF